MRAATIERQVYVELERTVVSTFSLRSNSNARENIPLNESHENISWKVFVFRSEKGKTRSNYRRSRVGRFLVNGRVRNWQRMKRSSKIYRRPDWNEIQKVRDRGFISPTGGLNRGKSWQRIATGSKKFRPACKNILETIGSSPRSLPFFFSLKEISSERCVLRKSIFHEP